MTKGPEAKLPDGYCFHDKGGHRRTEVRLKWWQQSALTWREIAASVPDISELPDVELPGDIKHTVYQPDAPPVFFGHYWLNGAPTLQASNALCLDYSAGKDGPLVAYRHEGSGAPIELRNLDN